MSTSFPKTLFELSGVSPVPAPLSDSVVILIDMQNDYVTGGLRLPGVEKALTETETLLAKARSVGTPIVHVVHKGADPKGLFGSETEGFAIPGCIAPWDGETIVEKTKPSAFCETTLAATLERLGRRHLVFAGFMTHMCVSTTVRDALHRGFQNTVVAAATATRALPSPLGGVVAAETLQDAALAALGDRFAAIIPSAESLVL